MARVVVLLGGASAERAVSLRTGRAVADALVRLGHDVQVCDPTESGFAARLIAWAPDVVFVALHGPGGEDGTIQGFLETLALPYTGSGVLASALATDKVRAKHLFAARGVPTPPYQLLEPGQGGGAVTLDLPVVTKPPREGSTIGIGIARVADELDAAIAGARAHDPRVLVEGFVEGREVTVGVIDGEALPVVEIVPKSGFYDYESKYTDGHTRYLCPAPLEPATTRLVSDASLAAYRVLGCTGGARVDAIVDDHGRPWVLEVNTIPGMTPTSLLPKAAAAAGLRFDDLVRRLLEGALPGGERS